MSKTAGGAATASGMDYQNRATAWVAVQILAEKKASPPWSLPATTTLDWFRSETEQPVDDLLVVTSADGVIFSQIKHKLSLSQTQGSELASALDQCVRQFIACQSHSHGKRPWERPLEPGRDRLVVMTGPNSSAPIGIHLPAVLDRLQGPAQSQSLEKIARNEQEQRALSVVRNHIKRSWHATFGTLPTDSEVQQLLRLLRIQVLDVDHGGTSEREAQDLLRTAVLRCPDQADAAWGQLIALCARLAANRSGADRPGLRQTLLDAGLEVQAAHSYRDDIERLKAHSQTAVHFLTNLARIRVGTVDVKLQRRSTDELRHAADEGSLLVVGEPGAGKSGTLHDLAQTLLDQGQDVVFLAVDRLSAQSLGELRGELGLDRNLTDILENWPGMNPAFLIIDALDAARAELAARAIRELIQIVVEQRGRWRVVASIRKFDLRYNQDLRQLFLGEPPTTFRDIEFSGIRHLNVPQLSDEEFDEVRTQSPALKNLLDNAPEELRELLRVPFNLRIIAELLGAGLELADLTPIRTQLELLDRYWAYRVIRSDRQGDARETVLRQTCEAMVKDRTLRIDRSRVVDSTGSQLNDLLSTQVLTEWQPSPAGTPDRYVLTFSHHVLFDYAVARLLLRGSPDVPVTRLTDDPELVIVIRPSLLLHFRHLWTVDPSRTLFWQLVSQIIRSDKIPEIGKLIGSAVGAEMAEVLPDLEPLYTALENTNTTSRSAAEQALDHLVGALLAVPSDKQTFIGPHAGPWCELLERVSRQLRAKEAYTVRSLLSAICDHPEAFTTEQRLNAGKTARRLLEFAWTYTPRDQWLVIHALQAVCRTFESNPIDSAALLRRSFELEHLAKYGFEEMPSFAQEVNRLIPLDSALVEDVYKAVFAYRETSAESTPMGQSRILPMRSNRRQDYDMALYGLAEIFPEFLAFTPRRATSALIAVLEAYIANAHPSASSKEIESFNFDGKIARIRADYSCIWDAHNTYGNDNPIKMLDAFNQHLEGLAESEECVEDIREIMEVVVEENQSAVLWRRLLLLGAQFPKTLGKKILSLAWAMPILTGIDTSDLAGEFIRSIFPDFDHADRERVERTLLSIPDAYPMENPDALEHIRNRLLGCLTYVDLVIEETRCLFMDLQDANALPANKPPVSIGEVTSQPFGEVEYLAGEGVPVDEEANRKIREIEQPVKAFRDKHLNSVPTPEEIAAVLPALQALRMALSCADADGVHSKQQTYAWGCLTDACVPVTRMDGFLCEEPVGVFTREVLLTASYHSDPMHNPEYDVHFDESPSWGSPAGRVGAARGLVLLARHVTCATPEVLQAIERLSTDPAPAVRYQIARGLDVLYRTAPELMWGLTERLCREESSRGVLQGLLSGPLGRLAGAHPDRVAALTKAVYDRVQEGPGAKTVRELCIDIFTMLYIWRDNTEPREIVLGIVTNPITFPDECGYVLKHFRESLTHGPVNSPDPQQHAIRQRAFDLILRLLRATRDSLNRIEEAYPKFNDLPEAEQTSAQSFIQIIDHIGTEIYFASGAYDAKRQNRTDDSGSLTDEEKARFYGEAGPILDALAEVGLPRLAYHLLETLESFIPIDPEGIFLRIGQVLQSGQAWGYQYETLGADLMVRLIERYLAEYRSLLRQNDNCRRTMLEVLDIFVKPGWPSARRLTYRLEEIFR